MFRLIITGLLIYAVYRLAKKPRKPVPSPDAPKELVQDPYCKTYFPRENAIRLSADGETHYFCSKECLKAYQSGKKES